MSSIHFFRMYATLERWFPFYLWPKTMAYIRGLLNQWTSNLNCWSTQQATAWFDTNLSNIDVWNIEINLSAHPPSPHLQYKKWYLCQSKSFSVATVLDCLSHCGTRAVGTHTHTTWQSNFNMAPNTLEKFRTNSQALFASELKSPKTTWELKCTQGY